MNWFLRYKISQQQGQSQKQDSSQQQNRQMRQLQSDYAYYQRALQNIQQQMQQVGPNSSAYQNLRTLYQQYSELLNKIQEISQMDYNDDPYNIQGLRRDLKNFEDLFSGKPLNPFENVTVKDPRNPNKRVQLN